MTHVINRNMPKLERKDFEMRKYIPGDVCGRYFSIKFSIFSNGTTYVDDGTCNIFETVEASRNRARLMKTYGYEFVK